VLHELAEQLLDDGDRVEISKHKRTITILSTKAKAETVLQTIDRVVRRMRTRIIDATVFGGGGQFTHDELESLGEITNTAIGYDSLQEKVCRSPSPWSLAALPNMFADSNRLDSTHVSEGAS